MGFQWTKEQQQVISERNCNILVSAAAGSGKTAVLVERIITRLTKDENPINVDELLIVTFTEAAAAEMKERILQAIEKALEEDSDNEHLQRQATLIHNASITTIHSFCLSVIRDYFHVIDLDPVFRIGDDGELKLLQQDVLAQVLEEEYQEKRDSFLYFVESMASGRNDKNIEELILELYKYSRSYPLPDLWLEDCIQRYAIDSVDELEHSVMGQFILEDTENEIFQMQEKLERAIGICQGEYGHKPYIDTFLQDKVLLDYVAEAEGLEALYQAMITAKFEGLSRKRDKEADPEKKEEAKKLRDSVKADFEKLRKKFFLIPPMEQVEVLQGCRGNIEELVRLLQKFSKAYTKEKQSKNLLDFNDMEHYALQILTVEQDGILVPSEVAREYQDKFQEVMIDEYQDSNLIQENILTSVSKVSQGSYNIFMVGDVKQSIYKFRLSRPELFMEKFAEYEDAGREKIRIDLGQNFRSRREVLDSTNFVFDKIMKRSLGGVEYDEKARLNLGANYVEMPDNEAEILILNKEMEASDTDIKGRDNQRRLEAISVARRIKELVGHHQVFDKRLDDYRPASYGDVVLLSRSVKGWSDIFAEVLMQEGVPTSVESGEGYFSTWEIALLLDYLSVLDNFKQDIPLAAVLRSCFGEISDNEMAMIRGTYPKLPFHQAVLKYSRCEENPLQEKLRKCLERMNGHREKASHLPMQELLRLIIEGTGYRYYITAMPGGEQRSANLEMLLVKAAAFESTSYRGLFNFIRYIQLLKKYEVDFGEASLLDERDDAVRIMSIHKSKGLEFPIVFLIGMGKEFNLQDAKKRVVVHPELGLGMEYILPDKRVRTTSLMKNVIQKQIALDALGEELRVLYVAMTRAKEKLILSGWVKDLTKSLGTYRGTCFESDGTIGQEMLTKAKTYYDWVLPCVYMEGQYSKEKSPFMVRVIKEEELIQKEVVETLQKKWNQKEWAMLLESTKVDEDVRNWIEEQFAYQYQYLAESNFQLKLTVTEIKKRTQLEEEGGEHLHSKKWETPTIPEFIKQKQPRTDGAFRGTSYHRFLEMLDFSKEYIEEDIQETIRQLVEDGRMPQEMADFIDQKKILEFLQEPIAVRMREAAKNQKLYKEQPFVIGVPADTIYGVETEEIVLVQGIIDAYFEEDGKIILVDYKTDKGKTKKELEEAYHQQLEYYEKALVALTGKPVVEKNIISIG